MGRHVAPRRRAGARPGRRCDVTTVGAAGMLALFGLAPLVAVAPASADLFGIDDVLASTADSAVAPASAADPSPWLDTSTWGQHLDLSGGLLPTPFALVAAGTADLPPIAAAADAPGFVYEPALAPLVPSDPGAMPSLDYHLLYDQQIWGNPAYGWVQTLYASAQRPDVVNACVYDTCTSAYPENPVLNPDTQLVIDPNDPVARWALEQLLHIYERDRDAFAAQSQYGGIAEMAARIQQSIEILESRYGFLSPSDYLPPADPGDSGSQDGGGLVDGGGGPVDDGGGYPEGGAGSVDGGGGSVDDGAGYPDGGGPVDDDGLVDGGGGYPDGGGGPVDDGGLVDDGGGFQDGGGLDGGGGPVDGGGYPDSGGSDVWEPDSSVGIFDLLTWPFRLFANFITTLFGFFIEAWSWLL